MKQALKEQPIKVPEPVKKITETPVSKGSLVPDEEEKTSDKESSQYDDESDDVASSNDKFEIINQSVE